MSEPKRYVLIQARESDEEVGPEEHASFAQNLGVAVEAIEAVSAIADPLDIEAVLDRCDAVLVGGSGRFGVNDPAPWMHRFFDFLGGVAARDFPMFASCFGFQGLCMAYGAPVRKDPDAAEVGTYTLAVTDEGQKDPLFIQLPRSFPAQLGHKDRAFELPADAVWLARSERCPYQAMRLGQRVYATQFHPELDAQANKRRFLQYWDEYAVVLGEEEAQRVLLAFEDSSDASALLTSFAREIVG